MCQIILCCDGVQLFKSLNQSFWPIISAITNLAPDIRMNAENLILAGVWQGTGKPPMKVILSTVLVKINQLYTKGVHIQSSQFSGKKIVKAKLLMAVFDLPARLVQQISCSSMAIIAASTALIKVSMSCIDKYSYQMNNMSHETVPLLNNMQGKQRRKEDQFLVLMAGLFSHPLLI